MDSVNVLSSSRGKCMVFIDIHSREFMTHHWHAHQVVSCCTVYIVEGGPHCWKPAEKGNHFNHSCSRSIVSWLKKILIKTYPQKSFDMKSFSYLMLWPTLFTDVLEGIVYQNLTEKQTSFFFLHWNNKSVRVRDLSQHSIL